MGFLSDLFGGPDEVTTTQERTVNIPEFLRPLIEGGASTGQGALSALSGLVNGGGLVSGFNQDQLSSFDLARSLALGNDSPFATATQTLSDTASGAGFDSDAFQNAFGAAVRRQQPGIISPFIAAGRGTGGLAQTALGQAQADAFAGLFSQERDRQLNSALSLPGMASQPFSLLSQIGGLQQQQAQREIDAPIQAQQGLLGSSLGAVPTGSLLGSTGTNTQPVHSNPLGSALGLGLSAAGMFMGGPMGASLGGSLGGLFGGPRFGAFGGGS